MKEFERRDDANKRMWKIKEKVVKKKPRVADVFYPQKSPGQESE